MVRSEVGGGLREKDFPVSVERGERRATVERRVELGGTRHEVPLEFDEPVAVDVEAERRRHVVLYVLSAGVTGTVGARPVCDVREFDRVVRARLKPLRRAV